MTFEERKYKRENLQKFQGKSSKSGVLGSLFSNKEERGLSKRFKQYTSILKSKYMQRTVDLEDVFCSRLVSTCSEFVRKLRAQALRSSVFIKPLFAGVAYSLLREECQGSEFLINLKDILRFLSPPRAKIKTKMALAYLRKFRDLTQTKKCNSESKRIQTIFKVFRDLLLKYSKDQRDFKIIQPPVLDWAQKIFNFRDHLKDSLLYKNVKNLTEALLYLALNLAFPQQKIKFSDFLNAFNSPHKKVSSQSRRCINSSPHSQGLRSNQLFFCSRDYQNNCSLLQK